MQKQVILLLVVVVALAAAAQWDGPRRTITVEKTDHILSVRAVKKTAPINAVSFRFTTNWVPRFVFRYFHANSDTADLFAARWVLMKIFEYNEVDGVAGFLPGTDTIVTENEHRLWQLNGWSNINTSKTDLGDGETMYTACTSAPATANQIGCTICFDVSSIQVNTSIGGTRRKLSPNAVKWSIGFSGLSLTNTSNRYAFKLAFEGAEFATNYTNSDSFLSSNEDGTVLYDSVTNRVLSTWIKTVDISGCGSLTTADLIKGVFVKNDSRFDTDALPSTGDDDSLNLLRTVNYFSVNWAGNDCNPSAINWDPEFGATGESSASNVVVSFFALIVLIAIAL